MTAAFVHIDHIIKISEIASQCCVEITCPCSFFPPGAAEQTGLISLDIKNHLQKGKKGGINKTRQKQLQPSLMLPKTRKTGDINLLSAMTKDSSASECSAFSGDQGSTLFEKKAIKCVCFHPDSKELFCQTSAALENNAMVKKIK